MDIKTKALFEHIRSPLYKNSFFLLVDSAVTAGLGFFFWMVVARFYSEVDVGFGSAAISGMSLVGTLSLFGCNLALIRFLPKADKPLEMINSCLTLSGIASMVLAVIFVIGLGIWSPALIFIQKNPIFGIAFVSFTALYTLTSVMDSVFIARRRSDLILSMDTISSILKIPLPAILAVYFHSFGIAASWGIAIAMTVCVSVVLFLPKAHKNYKPLLTLDTEILRRLWHYSSWTYVASLFSTAPTWVLPIIIVNVKGSEQNAYFYITWIISSLLASIAASASNSLFAEGSHYDQDLRTNVRQAFKFTYSLLIPAMAIILLFGSQILAIFGKAYSVHGSNLLRIMAFSSLFVGANVIYHSILRVENRIKELCIICAIPTVAVLAGSYWLTPRAGTIAVGYLWLGAQAGISLYVIFAMRKYLGAKKQ